MTLQDLIDEATRRLLKDAVDNYDVELTGVIDITITTYKPSEGGKDAYAHKFTAELLERDDGTWTLEDIVHRTIEEA